MTTRTENETKTKARQLALSAIASGEGLMPHGKIDDETKQLFGLESNNASELADKLRAVREHLEESEDLEVAFYSLGIDAPFPNRRLRQEAMFSNRGVDWKLMDLVLVPIQQNSGFHALAVSYDLVQDLLAKAEKKHGKKS